MELNQHDQTPFILLRVADVARRLNVSRAMAYRLMQRGEIPIVRVGLSVRVRSCDLEEFIRINLTPANRSSL